MLQPLSCIQGPYSQLVRFEDRLQFVDEVVSMLLCSRMSETKVFEFLERRWEVGRFAK